MTDPDAAQLARKLRDTRQRADALEHQVEQYEALVDRLQRHLRRLRELHPDSEGTGVPHGHMRVTVSTEYGHLTPQTVTASNLREALTRAYALPIAAWVPPDDAELTLT